MSLKDYLKRYDDAFAKASEEEPKRGPIPEGQYLVTVASFTPGKSKAGKLMFTWELEIYEGEHAGRTVKKYSSLATEQTLGFFKIDLLKAGLKLNNISDLPDRMGEMFGKRLLVTIKPKQGGGYNTYIEGLADETKNPAEELADKLFGNVAKTPDDSDLPF